MKRLSFLFIALIFSFSVSANNHTEKEDNPADQNIVELAAQTDMLSTLVTAVKAGDLVSTLASDGPFTVFAPTNEAFSKLPKETLDALLKPENKEKLQQILTYHVVKGSISSDQLSDGQMAETVEGSSIKVKKGYGKVKINDAEVIKANINAKNGMVHVIDQVIIPPDFKL